VQRFLEFGLSHYRVHDFRGCGGCGRRHALILVLLLNIFAGLFGGHPRLSPNRCLWFGLLGRLPLWSGHSVLLDPRDRDPQPLLERRFSGFKFKLKTVFKLHQAMAKQTSVALLLSPLSTPVRLLNSNDACGFFSVFLYGAAIDE